MSESNANLNATNELQALAATRIMGEDVPKRLLIVPWGEVDSLSGAFLVDEESGRMVTQAFAAHGADLPIDFEHQTLGGEFASPSGTAPAAGWITALEAMEGQGIVATVNWTDHGRKMLADRAYRYVSPVALVRKRDRKLVALHSAALTNKPAIVGMAAIVNRDPVGQAESEQELLCHVLSLPREANVEQVLASARGRILELEASAARSQAEQLVRRAMAAGKLTDSQRAWALDLALNQPKRFQEWERTAPTVLPLGRTRPPELTSSDAAGARARQEYRGSRLLQSLTSEEAYLAEALRLRNG